MMMEVLIIDDNRDHAELAKIYISKDLKGAKVVIAHSYLELLGIDFTEVDVVICDYDLKTHTVDDVIKWMRAKNIHVPLIIISGVIERVSVAGHEFLDKADLRLLPQVIKKVHQINKQAQILNKYQSR